MLLRLQLEAAAHIKAALGGSSLIWRSPVTGGARGLGRLRFSTFARFGREALLACVEICFASSLEARHIRFDDPAEEALFDVCCRHPLPGG